MTEEISHSSSCHLLGNYYALKGTNGQVALEQHLLKDKRYSSKQKARSFQSSLWKVSKELRSIFSLWALTLALEIDHVGFQRAVVAAVDSEPWWLLPNSGVEGLREGRVGPILPSWPCLWVFMAFNPQWGLDLIVQSHLRKAMDNWVITGFPSKEDWQGAFLGASSNQQFLPFSPSTSRITLSKNM